MTAIGLTVLLLERVLYLFSLVANPSTALSYVGQMLLMLTPHYLSIALPAAFFFGVLLTFGRLKQDGEFVVLMAAGCGLGRLLAPVVGLALLMTLLAVLILGFINPHAHYAYRALKHTVAQASLNAAVLEGTFIQADGLTFFAEGSALSPEGLELNKVFVYEKGEDGQTIVVTGRNGRLARDVADGRPVLMLEKGVRAEVAADGAGGNALSFSDLSWPVDTETEAFRARGRDQKELTLTELWKARRHATAESKPTAAEIAAELHGRLVQIASVPLLALLAAPLALAGSRRSRRGGIVVGLLILIVYYEALNFGGALAKRELLAPAIGLWLPFALLVAGTWHLLRRALRGSPPGEPRQICATRGRRRHMSSIIGRYVARLLLGRFIVLLAGLATLMLLLKFLADSDQVIAASDDALKALSFYMVLQLPDVLAELIPVAALLAGLLTFAELGRHSELTAIYAGGLSKTRLAVAILPLVALIGTFQFLVEDQARPAARAELRAWGVGDYDPANDDAAATWVRRGTEILRIHKIDLRRRELQGVTIFQRDADGNLIAKIEAARAVPEGGSWMLHDAVRSQVGSAIAEVAARMPWSGDLAPADLELLATNPQEMPLIDLLRVVRHPDLGSQPAYRYQTWLNERLASPVTTAMLLFLTVALARPPRGRAAQGMLIAVGIGIGFLLWTFDGIVLNFGDLGLLPPLLAAWTPVPVIAAIAGSIVLHDHGSGRAGHPAWLRGDGARPINA